MCKEMYSTQNKVTRVIRSEISLSEISLVAL